MSREIVIRNQDYFTDNIPFCMNHYEYDHYESIHLHSHEFIEIAFVRSGHGYHILGDHRYEVSKGDLYIINFDTPHSFFPYDKENTQHLSVYNCMFLPEFLHQLHIELGILKEIIHIFLYKSIYSDEIEYTPDLQLSGRLLGEVETLFEKMYWEYTQKQDGYIEVLKILLSELLIKIYRFHRRQQQAAPVQDHFKSQLIYDSIHYLESNYSGKLNLDSLSRHVYLSKSYYCALFKKVTGMSVVEYLQKIRIQKACLLLAESDRKVTEIAEEVGYNDYKFFNKTFKRIMGMTAAEYKKKSAANH